MDGPCQLSLQFATKMFLGRVFDLAETKRTIDDTSLDVRGVMGIISGLEKSSFLIYASSSSWACFSAASYCVSAFSPSSILPELATDSPHVYPR